MNTTPKTISQGIQFFKERYIFSEKNTTTQRMYFRSAHLFGLFLLLGDDGITEKVAKQFRNHEKVRADLDEYIKHRYFEAHPSTPAPPGADRLPIKVDISQARLADLHPTVLAEFLGWLKKDERNDHQGYSDSSVQVYLSAIRNLLKFWRTYDLISFSSDQENAAIEGSRTRVRKSSRSRSLANRVPEQFAETMLREAMSVSLPSPEKRYKRLRLERLNVLRTRAVIYTLAASALRVSDLVRLKKADLLPARRDETVKIISKKTGLPSEIYFHPDVLAVLDAYLDERDDISPWIFIQHGRAGKKVTPASTQAFMREENRRGYGQRLSEHTIREIVKAVAVQAGYLEEDGSNPNELYCSPHAFRHEYANRLRQLGVPLADIQDVLGHADPGTTKKAYATKANIPAIIAAGQSLQALPEDLKDRV